MRFYFLSAVTGYHDGPVGQPMKDISLPPDHRGFPYGQKWF
jgi:hypothetical protein